MHKTVTRNLNVYLSTNNQRTSDCDENYQILKSIMIFICKMWNPVLYLTMGIQIICKSTSAVILVLSIS